MNIGLTLPNRGVMFGATNGEQLLRMARIADECGQFDSVFVGDSLLAKPRLESIVLLSAVAAITKRVRLGQHVWPAFRYATRCCWQHPSGQAWTTCLAGAPRSSCAGGSSARAVRTPKLQPTASAPGPRRADDRVHRSHQAAVERR